MADITKKDVISNFSWRYMERFGSQAVGFIVSIVLARLMAPEAFGVVAIVSVFTTLLNVFVDSGFGNALIQKKNADNVDFSSVFYFNVFSCGVLYLLLYAVAPLIATLYDNFQLTALIRVASLSLIVSGLRNVQQAYVSRNMLFKKFFMASVIALFISAFLGIFFAYRGYGAWAIVIQQLSNTGMSTLLLWFIVRWRPSRVFSFERLRGLFSYGWKLLAASLIDSLVSEIRSLLIGKVYTPADLAFYDRGKVFPYAVMSGINTSFGSVIFPVLSRYQDNMNDRKIVIRKSIRMSVFFVFPIMIWLAVSAHSIVSVLLTEKWLPCVLFMQILCFETIFWPVVATHQNAVNSIGRSDVYLKIIATGKTITICLLVASIFIGVVWVAVSSVVLVFCTFVFSACANHRLNHYRYREQASDLLQGVSPAVCVGGAAYLVSVFPLSPLWMLVLQILGGCLAFVGYGMMTKHKEMGMIIKMFVSKIKR